MVWYEYNECGVDYNFKGSRDVFKVNSSVVLKNTRNNSLMIASTAHSQF